MLGVVMLNVIVPSAVAPDFVDVAGMSLGQCHKTFTALNYDFNKICYGVYCMHVIMQCAAIRGSLF
jgi:hypothetical protein